MTQTTIAIAGHTNSAPYEVDFLIGETLYLYGAGYSTIQNCLFIDKKCKRTGKKALSYIKQRADYCLKATPPDGLIQECKRRSKWQGIE